MSLGFADPDFGIVSLAHGGLETLQWFFDNGVFLEVAIRMGLRWWFIETPMKAWAVNVWLIFVLDSLCTESLSAVGTV